VTPLLFVLILAAISLVAGFLGASAASVSLAAKERRCAPLMR
jgi:hypothetical protein